jgi:hypothetical protein
VLVLQNPDLTSLTSAAAFFVASTPMVDTVFFLHLLPRFVHPANFNQCHLEMEFLDINLTKYQSLLLHAIHSPFSWRRTLKKTKLYSGLKNTNRKICKTRKLESIHE